MHSSVTSSWALETDAHVNYTKLCRLLYDGGTLAVKTVFDGIVPPASLGVILKTNTHKLLKLKKPTGRLLSKDQWDLLYPQSGASPKSVDFDITLLFVLLRNICGLTPPATGKDGLPLTTDTSLEANLARIKHYRNVIAHSSKAEVDDPDFETYWNNISGALVALGLKQDDIDKLKSCPLGEKDYNQLVNDWYLSDAVIKSELGEIKRITVESTTKIQSEIKSIESRIQSEFAELKATTSKIQAEMAQFKSTTSQIQPEIAEIKSTTPQIQSKTAEIKSTTSQIQSETAEIKPTTSQIQPDTAEIKPTTSQRIHVSATSSWAQETDATVNYIKLCRLIFIGGKFALRTVFDAIVPPGSLPTTLATFQHEVRRRMLSAHHWNQLYPPGGASPKSEDFDITLLFVLLRNICNLVPPATGWNTFPPQTDTSLEANLVRIKYYRNEFVHSNTEIDNTQFETYWHDISGALVALGLKQDDIDWLKLGVDENPLSSVSSSSNAVIPSEIRARGPTAQAAYNQALKCGKKVKNRRLPVVLVGQSRSGKTSLLKSLNDIH